MNPRLLPWAAMALLVPVLAVWSAVPERKVEAAASSREAALTGPEIRLGPVGVKELHDDGSWNRLDAEGAVYGYASGTVAAREVTVSFRSGKELSGTTVRAPRATWDLDGKSIALPDGCRAAREGGWAGALSAATLDLAGRVLRVPGPARIEGPGVSVEGRNLAWHWGEGGITMDAPKSRIVPPARSRKRG
ncbi:MAG: hypothetical protein OHK0028_01680 [Deltaproteobacteria bacterium]